MKLDVPQLIEDLEDAGLADAEIALHCGVWRSAVSAWRNADKLPSLIPGLNLLLLHFEHCPDRSPLRTISLISFGPSALAKHGESPKRVYVTDAIDWPRTAPKRNHY